MKAKDDDINKLGRQIYNYQSEVDDFDKFYFSRIEDQSTGTLLSRSIEIQCVSIKDMIKHQRLIDQSLIFYLKKMDKEAKTSECIYNASFSISYKFLTFISNIESVALNTSTSDKPYRISEVKTLGAYTNMEYSCWNVLNNKKIQSVFKGQYNEHTSYEENYAFSQVVSLFACESSRNPTTYITAPMVLEVAEKFFYSTKGQIEREDKREAQKVLSLKLCHKYDNEYLPILKQLKKQCNTEKEYNDKFVKLANSKEIVNIEEEIEKSNNIIEILNNKALIIKDYFLNLFPMAIDKAVSGSRVTSDKLNQTHDSKYFHQYDLGRPNINKEKELEEKNNTLKQLWQDNFPDREITDLIKDWYDIDLIGE